MKFVKSSVSQLQKFASKDWYAWCLGALAGLDVWIFVIPTDGLVISSALLAPRKGLQFLLLTSFGSTLGAASFAVAFTEWGLPWLQGQWPELMISGAWVWTEELFKVYGLWLLLAVAAAPLMIHPVLVLSLVAHHSIAVVLGVVLAGRLFKYGLMIALAKWAPASISRLWGMKHELEDVGLCK